jgi:hypothetical protein
MLPNPLKNASVEVVLPDHLNIGDDRWSDYQGWTLAPSHIRDPHVVRTCRELVANLTGGAFIRRVCQPPSVNGGCNSGALVAVACLAVTDWGPHITAHILALFSVTSDRT